METSIYYFTGTGNSLFLARGLADRVAEAKVYPITTLDKRELVLSGVVGFVFPVHVFDVPALVRKICLNTNLENAQYIFCVANCGDQAGNTITIFRKILRAKNKELDYGAVVKMPDNSIFYKTSAAEIEKRFSEVGPVLDRMATAITNKARNADELTKSRMWVASSVALKLAMKYYLRVGDKVAEEEKCIHCGLCQKICPTGNIAMADNRIAFGENCTNCFGCINWCPAKAIRFGRINVEKARQYRCPGIRAEELMNGGGWQSRQELDG